MAVNVKRNPKNVSRPPSKKCYLMAVNFNEVSRGTPRKISNKKSKTGILFWLQF